MSSLAQRRKLRFSEPENVLECLHVARRETEWKDVPERLRVCMEEVLGAGLVDLIATRRGAKFGAARKVLQITPQGRKRVVEANKAAQSAAGAPVEWRP
jgi:hypothetical protein